MAIPIRMAQTTWEGPLASGTGTVRLGSGAAGELPVTWAARTERADGKTSAEELAAAAHSACYAMALALALGERKAAPQRLAVTATVTLDQADGVAAIVSSHLDVTTWVPGLDKTDRRCWVDAEAFRAIRGVSMGPGWLEESGPAPSAGAFPSSLHQAGTRAPCPRPLLGDVLDEGGNVPRATSAGLAITADRGHSAEPVVSATRARFAGAALLW